MYSPSLIWLAGLPVVDAKAVPATARTEMTPVRMFAVLVCCWKLVFGIREC